MAAKAKDEAVKLNVSAATVADALDDIVAYKAKVTSATGKLRARRKYWQDQGVNLKVLDEMIALKNQDEQDVRDDEVDRQRYAKWLQVDLGFQAELDIPAPEPSVVEKVAKHDAYWIGHAAGKNGDVRNPERFGVGTIAQAAYDQGWNDGDTEVFDNAKPPRKVKKGAGPEMTAKPADGEPAAEDGPDAADPVPQTAEGQTIN